MACRYGKLRRMAEANPEKMISSKRLQPKVLRRDLLNARWNSFFVDFSGHFELSFSRSLFITGKSSLEISIPEHVTTQKVFVFNKAKAVLDFNTQQHRPKILQVHIYDHAEVYVDAGNYVSVFVRFMSPDGRATVKIDDTCTVTKSIFDRAGLIAAEAVRTS